MTIQCNETALVSNRCLMVITVSNLHNGSIYERFWIFRRVIVNSAHGLTQSKENDFNTFSSNSVSKLIAQI